MNRFGWKQLLLIVPTIIVVLFLTNHQTKPTEESKQTTTAQMESDYQIRDVHISHIGEDGQLTNELFSELLTHYPHDDHSDLTAPRFQIHQKNGTRLVAESSQGVIYGEERLLLKRDVRIEQRSTDEQLTSHIESDAIEIERATQKVTSHEQVKISGTNYTIVAGNMELLANERQLKLGGGVEGHYEP